MTAGRTLKLTGNPHLPDAVDQRARFAKRNAAGIVALLYELAPATPALFYVDTNEEMLAAITAIATEGRSLRIDVDPDMLDIGDERQREEWAQLRQAAARQGASERDAMTRAEARLASMGALRGTGVPDAASVEASAELLDRVRAALGANVLPPALGKELGLSELELHAQLAPHLDALREVVPLGSGGQAWRAFLFGERGDAAPRPGASAAARRREERAQPFVEAAKATSGFQSLAQAARGAARPPKPKSPVVTRPADDDDDAGDVFDTDNEGAES